MDGARRVLEISEILDVDDRGNVVVNKLFEFEETGELTENKKNGMPHAVGFFRQVNPISQNMAKKFYRSSISKQEIEEFLTVDENQPKVLV